MTDNRKTGGGIRIRQIPVLHFPVLHFQRPRMVLVQEYRMTYRVFDDKFENSTLLIIQVLDVNDNPPRFDNSVYNVLDLYEEEPGISKSSPKYLLTVCDLIYSYTILQGWNCLGVGRIEPPPPVHVYRRSFLSENRFKISIPVQNFKHIDI